MTNIDHQYVNFQQKHELDYMLGKCGYRLTDDNRKWLLGLRVPALKHYGKTSNQHITHKELYDFIKSNFK